LDIYINSLIKKPIKKGDTKIPGGIRMEWDYNTCITIFNNEIDLLKKIFAVEESVHKAVMAREWADFEWKIAEIKRLGEDFSLLEGQRIGILAQLAEKNDINTEIEPGSESSFYALAAAKLSSKECREISGLYRELKMETLKIKVLNDTFMSYIDELRTMTAAWLEAVFPVQGGKLYTRKGRQAARDLRSVMLNQHI
jgi:hypothetical protein